VRLFILGGALAYRALFVWSSPMMFVSTLLVVPLFQLLFFAYLGRQLGVADSTFYVIGNGIEVSSIACVFGGTMAVANERTFGTLSHVVLSPRSRIALFLGRTLPYAANGFLTSLFTITAGAIILHLEIKSDVWLPLVAVIMVSSVAAAMFGLTLGVVALRVRDVWSMPNVVAVIMLLCTGAQVPLGYLPSWLRDVAYALPLTHGIAAARALVAGRVNRVPENIVAELVIGVIYAVVSMMLLRLLEMEARRRNVFDRL
jgi:ABC-type multidrug transport system permease subunit